MNFVTPTKLKKKPDFWNFVLKNQSGNPGDFSVVKLWAICLF